MEAASNRRAQINDRRQHRLGVLITEPGLQAHSRVSLWLVGCPVHLSGRGASDNVIMDERQAVKLSMEHGPARPELAKGGLFPVLEKKDSSFEVSSIWKGTLSPNLPSNPP